MGTIALTNIKGTNGEVAVGEKVNKKDFSKEEWADLVEAGAVGPEPPASLTVEEEVEEAVQEEEGEEEPLEDMTVEELQELAARLEIPGRSAMLKDDLVAAIEKAEAEK